MKLRQFFTNYNVLILLILLLALFLRFYKLTFQSFWLDEIHTAIEPQMGWKELFDYLKCCDQQSPFFYSLYKIIFFIFGNNEFVARAFSALAGTAGVWAIYILGRELYSRQLGLIAALFTCINYFHIWYSQEARPYALAFLFTCISFLFLIRLMRLPGWKHALLYALFTLLMIITHYFGLFVVMAQIVIAFIFWIYEKNQKKEFLKFYVISGLIVAGLFAPFLTFLLAVGNTTSFWILPIPADFAIIYFYEFFGNSGLLKPFLWLFLISAMVQFFLRSKSDENIFSNNTYVFTFLIIFLWIVITLLIPYLRSVLLVPMLTARYMIYVLPAFLILLAFGVVFISNNIIRSTLLVFFFLLSVIDIFIVKKYYSTPLKTQFREMAEFIAADTSYHYPLFSDVTAWQQSYYLDKYGFNEEIMDVEMEAIPNIILQRSEGGNDLEAFWLADAHGAAKPSREIADKLKSKYLLHTERDFFDAWAQLYVARHSEKFITLDHTNFNTGKFELEKDSVAAIWSGEAVTEPIPLKNGEYQLTATMKGTSADNIFPILDIVVNDTAKAQFTVTGEFQDYTMNFTNSMGAEAIIKINMVNDTVVESTGQDRNAFIKTIFIRKIR